MNRLIKLQTRYFPVILFIFCFSTAYSQSKVMLDNYYNNEIDSKTKKPYHYLWEDHSAFGFSELGKLFTGKGCLISELKERPSRKKLKEFDVYIIVDPDTKQEAESPNLMNIKDAKQIAQWVKNGGKLLVLANDVNNCELNGLNILMEYFGMKFNNDVLHIELSKPKMPRNFNSCASSNLPDHQLFRGVNKIFLKGIASITCTSAANPILMEDGKILIAESLFGNGRVIAVGDPWLYNEYIDNRYLPADFDNYAAAKNLVKLLIEK